MLVDKVPQINSRAKHCFILYLEAFLLARAMLCNDKKMVSLYSIKIHHTKSMRDKCLYTVILQFLTFRTYKICNKTKAYHLENEQGRYDTHTKGS